MQATDAGGGKKTPADEESINFRPSPNFKHMKKYLKSKFEEMSLCTEQEKPKPPQPTPVEEKPVEPKPDKMEKPIQTKPPPPPPPATVQPPLPPNPPPPDSPPPTIKQEIIDDEYNQYLQASMPMQASMEQMDDKMHQYTTEMPQTPSKDQGITMCRNFVRGTCTKGAQCIFVHELILDQLPGVYTFCRNFQNGQCTFSRCKFIHATVFEKEYFYRTGYLPPHTRAHLLKLQAPPPPPPPEEPQTAAVQQTMLPVQDMHQAYYTHGMDMTGAYQTTPVADMSSQAVPTYMLQSPLPTVNEQHNIYAAGPSTSAGPNTSLLKRDWATAMTAPSMEEEQANMYAAAPSTSQLKRDWVNTMISPSMEKAAYGMPTPEMPTEEPMPKRCKDCDSNEFRYQYNKNKVENMITSQDDLAKKMNQLRSKTERLCLVLMTLFKPQSSPMFGFGGMTELGEKDKAILEQLNLLLATNARMPLINENDNMKNLLGISNINFHNIIAQLLMHSGDPTSVQ